MKNKKRPPLVTSKILKTYTKNELVPSFHGNSIGTLPSSVP